MSTHPDDLGRHCANGECRAHFEPSASGQKFCEDCSIKLCILCADEVPPSLEHRVCVTCVESREVCARCAEPKPRTELCEQCEPDSAAQNAIRRSFQQ